MTAKIMTEDERDILALLNEEGVTREEAIAGFHAAMADMERAAGLGGVL